MKFSEMAYERLNMGEIICRGRELTEQMKQAQSGENAWEVHQNFLKLSDHVYTMHRIAQIRRDIDTSDAFYEAETEYYDQENPKFQAVENEYQKALLQSPWKGAVEEKTGPVPFASMELARKAFDEKLIGLRQEENRLCSRYSKLIASASIEWEGDTKNLSLMRPYQTSTDRNVRKAAWEKVSEFFAQNGAELDEIYDLLVKNRTAQAKALGFEHFTELGYCRMNRNSYSRSEIETLRKQIKESYVPFAEQIHEKRRQRIGVDHLYYYDEGVYFKEGDPSPKGSPEEILQNGRKMYAELSEETHQFFKQMMENELFDVLGKKKKKAGGYMEELPDYRVPFIFANFNGTSGDLDVITHECGHGFQYYISAQDPIRDHNKYMSMETAEIHSMSMEFFTEPWMKLFLEEQTQAYLQLHLEDAAVFIPYGTMVDEFQHIVYDQPELTPAQRREAWMKLEKEYRPHMDYGENEAMQAGRFWQKQLHIFEYPFYYIDYVLAQLVAFEYKIWMDKDYKEAWKSYLQLCRLSASEFYPRLLADSGLKLPFEQGCIQEIMEQLKEKMAF